jgi:uncharacterized membrane protein
MNEAHAHLVINHFPIILPMIALVLLVFGIFQKNETLQKTALWIFVVGAIFTFFAMFTGDKAEHFIENFSGISEQKIENHEEMAEQLAWLQYMVGIISLIGLFLHFKKNQASKYVHYLLLILTIVLLFFAQKTGTSGGEIRHPEISGNANELLPANHNDGENEEQDYEHD